MLLQLLRPLACSLGRNYILSLSSIAQADRGAMVNEILMLDIDLALNPSESELQSNAEVNALIEQWVMGWGDSSVEDVLDAVESQGLSVDRYVNACVASMELSASEGGLWLPNSLYA